MQETNDVDLADLVSDLSSSDDQSIPKQVSDLGGSKGKKRVAKAATKKQ